MKKEILYALGLTFVVAAFTVVFFSIQAIKANRKENDKAYHRCLSKAEGKPTQAHCDFCRYVVYGDSTIVNP